MIDRDHLARQTAGDADLQRDVLTLFVSQLQELSRLLGKGLLDPDRGSALHRFRGAAMAVGAWELADRLAAAERIGPEAADPWRDAVEPLGIATAQAVAAAQRLIAAPPPAGLAKAGESH